MEVYKLLLLDIDGTLRDESLGIPNSAKEALHLCKQKQCKVVLCTGRSVGTIQEDVLELNWDGIIAGGGCYISYHNKPLYKQAFKHQDIQKTVAFLKKQDVAFSIESQDKVFMNQKSKEILVTMNQSKKAHKNINKQFIQEKIKYEDNLKDYGTQQIHKICLWSEEAVFKGVQQLLKETMVLAQEDTYEKMHYYEIIQKGCHKGDAIQQLQTHLSIPKEATLCFGDGQNDIAMFKASGVAVAMEKSHPRLKKAATAICEDVQAHGIYKELKRRRII